MGETNNEKTSSKKKSKFTDLKAEFKKIIWPDKATLIKQTTAVVAISVVLGVIISVLDVAIQYGVDFLVK
ncbi:MAG: preprotein translocase subunit SecE [Lachnospiraceae bacterium]|nr:preprotein translocase subunit SecE [Lachnospiraceae bacterium]